MRIRIDKDMTFTALEADGTQARYIVLFTLREEETGREYLVYTDGKVRAFRKDPVYGSRFRRDGEDLLLKAVETEEELELLRNALADTRAELDGEVLEEGRARRRAFFGSLEERLFQKRPRPERGGETL